MIRITNIEFENYRQYRSINVNFATGSENDLHILKAKNGTGKTTFLNGILWCLYDNEHYLDNKDKALPIVNSALVQESPEKEPLKVAVRLTLNDNGSIIVFERTQTFFVTVNPLSQVKSATPGQSKLKIIMTPTNYNGNSVVIEDETTVQSFVKQYFDEAIFDYYFFDGENLKNYFTQGKSEKIKASIFNISQVTLLSNASNHVRGMGEERARQAAKINKDTAPDLLDQIRQLEENISKKIAENSEIDQRIPELDAIIAEADAALQGYSPIRLNVERRTKLDGTLKRLKAEYESFISEKNTFIVTYMTLLHFYPRVKYTLDLIEKKQETGTLPPNIDKEQIERLLQEHAKNCPVCDGVLDAKAITHLQEVLSQLDVSSATSNYLMEIKGSLEQIVSKCKKFPAEYEAIIEKDKYYASEIAETQKQLDDISAFLAKYSDEAGSFDVQKVENTRRQAREERDSAKTRKALNESDISRYQQQLADKNAEKDRIESKRQQKDLLNRQVATFRTLTSKFDSVQTAIMNEIKEDIEKQTWERFSTMIWKKNTFGRLSINDKYELTVFNMDNNVMTGSLSATEYMALAYAFTLAIHDASGKNCPLVVDSPLGRVSDENRANMATELLKVSSQKQIIMLFTPDEYSDEVRRIYDAHAATIRDISLSESEDQIVGVGDTNA